MRRPGSLSRRALPLTHEEPPSPKQVYRPQPIRGSAAADKPYATLDQVDLLGGSLDKKVAAGGERVRRTMSGRSRPDSECGRSDRGVNRSACVPLDLPPPPLRLPPLSALPPVTAPRSPAWRFPTLRSHSGAPQSAACAAAWGLGVGSRPRPGARAKRLTLTLDRSDGGLSEMSGSSKYSYRSAGSRGSRKGLRAVRSPRLESRAVLPRCRAAAAGRP